MRPHIVWCVLSLACPVAPAVTITADYSSFGSIYQDAAGKIYTAADVGRTDVTSVFKSNIDTAFGYLQNSILLPWNETITFKTFDPGNTDAVADAVVDSVDANNRPATATIRFNTNEGLLYFLDATPWENTEFAIASSTTALGGGTVNNSRQGNATADGGAAGRWDLVTLALHEVEHTLGISSSLHRFLDLAGATGTANRKLTISKNLSGLTNDFDIPIVTDSAHYDGSNAAFNLAVVSEPGWGSGQRALPTALDILGICQVEGCTAAQMNTSLTTPEPVTLSLVGAGLVLVGLLRRRSKPSKE